MLGDSMALGAGWKEPKETMPMSFHFARVQDDGRLTSPLPTSFPTAEAAKAAAPDLLMRLCKRGGRIVLVQVLEEVRVTAKVEYDRWPDSTRKKHGVTTHGQG